MSSRPTDILPGTLDLLVLTLLRRRPMHGWGLVEALLAESGGVFRTNQGSVYPALQRLTRRGLVRAKWQTSEHNRRARYYALTAKGERALGQEERSWAAASGAINRILALGSGGTGAEAPA